MKKTLLFAAAVAVALTASAQSFVTTMGRWFDVIPSSLTTDGQGRMEIVDENDDNLTMHVQIFNGQLQAEATLDITCTSDSIIELYERQENDSTWSYEYDGNNLATITPMTIFYTDMSIGMLNYSSGFCFSQTLFNTTADYEYMVPVLSGTYSYEYDREDYYYDWENDTTIYYTVHWRRTQTKIQTINIKAANGNTVGTIQAPDGFSFNTEGSSEVIRMGNNWYIVFGVISMTTGERVYAWYRIDRQSQKINLMKTTPMRVYPNVVDRGQDITVELGDGMQATELEVVNTLGQNVKRVPVKPGQREVHIGTADLNRGMNFISSPKRGAVKIIVK